MLYEYLCLHFLNTQNRTTIYKINCKHLNVLIIVHLLSMLIATVKSRKCRRFFNKHRFF